MKKKTAEPCEDSELPPGLALKLKDSGLRLTQSRLRILDVLSRVDQALSPSELFGELQERFPKDHFDRVTVYRILEKFEELEIVHPVGDGKYIYCAHQTCGHDKHFIAICDRCHKVHEVGGEAKPLKVLSQYLEDRAGFRMTNDSIVVRGLCKNCQ